MKMIEEKTLRKFEKEATEMGKSSFKFAWALDERLEEREKGVTIDVNAKSLRTPNRIVTLLDSPGHRDFIPNMLQGASQADAAILVIDTNQNAFEAGFENGGQTKEHAYIIKSLGVKEIIVAMNKMDSIEWSKERFQGIRVMLLEFLLGLGFEDSSIHFVPISGLLGDNLITPSSNTPWNKITLLPLIDSLVIPPRETKKPFRMIISNAFTSHVGKIKGHALAGKIESGFLAERDKLIIVPSGIHARVKEITENGEKVNYGKPGDIIECSIALEKDYEMPSIKVGHILSSIDLHIPISNTIVVELSTFDLDYPLIKGESVMMFVNMAKSEGNVKRILKLLNPKTGECIKSNPKSFCC